MTSLGSLISTTWNFYRSQPVLNMIFFWFFFLPGALLGLLQNELERGGLTQESILFFLFPFALLALFVRVWGAACALIVGKRMLQSKAGRTRTSFKALHREAFGYTPTLFLTGILRECITLLYILPAFLPLALFLIVTEVDSEAALQAQIGRPTGMVTLILSILLLIPGIMYYIGTLFFHIVIILDEGEYRIALQKSRILVYEQMTVVVLTVIPLALLLFFLPVAISGLTPLFTGNILAQNVLTLAQAATTGFASMLFVLATIPLYGSLQGSRRSPDV